MTASIIDLTAKAVHVLQPQTNNITGLHVLPIGITSICTCSMIVFEDAVGIRTQDLDADSAQRLHGSGWWHTNCLGVDRTEEVYAARHVLVEDTHGFQPAGCPV